MKRIAALISALALGGYGCGSDGEDAEPAKGRGFTTRIDNPYWPMTPGTRWVYREHDGADVKRVEVTVTTRTKVVASGIRGRVLHDVVTENGRVAEDTYDWYAQDREGNVWYLGEDTKEYAPGKPPSTKGSWEAGVDGARAGIAMSAHPRPGMSYRQEYYVGEAEDEARVVSLDARARVSYGSFTRALQTRDFTRLDPGATEHKFYARGVGPVLSVGLASGGREELVSLRRG